MTDEENWHAKFFWPDDRLRLEMSALQVKTEPQASVTPDRNLIGESAGKILFVREVNNQELDAACRLMLYRLKFISR